MTVGIQVDKAQVDNKAGSIAQQLNIVMENIEQFNEWLSGQQDADLETNYDYSSGEVAVLKSAFSDLDQLRQVYQGTVNLADAKDFRAFAKQLWGLGF